MPGSRRRAQGTEPPGNAGRFSLEDARAYCTGFFRWCNDVHRHSGLGWHIPADVLTGRAPARRTQRAAVLARAYARTPERFVRHPPVPPALPVEVWINEPLPRPSGETVAQQTSDHPCLKVLDRFRDAPDVQFSTAIGTLPERDLPCVPGEFHLFLRWP